MAGLTHDDPCNGFAALKRKRNGRGRVPSTPQQRREAVAQFERSGLSGPSFCRVAGIRYQTLVGWRKEARSRPVTSGIQARSVEATQPAPIRIVEATPTAAPASSGGYAQSFKNITPYIPDSMFYTTPYKIHVNRADPSGSQETTAYP